MKNNSYARVAYKILRYLNDCYENGIAPNPDKINNSTLNITFRQFYQTMKILTEDGYVKGVMFNDVVPPEQSILGHLRDWRITSTGIEYLEENSLMKKAYKVVKEARDWLPLK